jgi:hypothetical protein
MSSRFTLDPVSDPVDALLIQSGKDGWIFKIVFAQINIYKAVLKMYTDIHVGDCYLI